MIAPLTGLPWIAPSNPPPEPEIFYTQFRFVTLPQARKILAYELKNRCDRDSQPDMRLA